MLTKNAQVRGAARHAQPIDTLLSRLEGARRTGHGQWVARCPAHNDRRPSLALREVDDGLVLLYCHAGCETQRVLAAVGLEFDALYPERAINHCVGRQRRPFDAPTTLQSLPTELTIVVIYCADVRAGLKPCQADYERFLQAVERITHAAALAGA